MYALSVTTSAVSTSSDAAQDVHLAEALALQAAQRAAQLAAVALDDVAGHAGPVGAAGVALGADVLRHVEHDGDRQHVVLRGPAATSCLRASGCTLVASTTVSRPAASRLPAM